MNKTNLQFSDSKFYTPADLNHSMTKVMLSSNLKFQTGKKLFQYEPNNFSNSKFFTQDSPDFKERKNIIQVEEEDF